MKIKLGNKNITIRKWKGKDKKNFINSLKEKHTQEQQVMDALVYSCIEENVTLSIDEFKYVLSRIRAESLGENIEFEFYCSSCGSLYKKTFELKDIIKYTFTDLKEIKSPGVHIVLGDIKNKDFYISKIGEDSIYDLLLRIKSFNGDDTFTLSELEQKFDEMDIDVLDKVVETFEQSKFKIQDINEVICPDCSKPTVYKFDELPGFFPESWFQFE